MNKIRKESAQVTIGIDQGWRFVDKPNLKRLAGAVVEVGAVAVDLGRALAYAVAGKDPKTQRPSLLIRRDR